MGLELLFNEENFARIEDADDNTIQLIKWGESFADIDVRINLFTVQDFEDAGGSLPPGQDVADPADSELLHSTCMVTSVELGFVNFAIHENSTRKQSLCSIYTPDQLMNC